MELTNKQSIDLVEALMHMCSQSIGDYSRGKGDGVRRNHMCMSTGEGAMDILVELGFATEVDGNHFNLLYEQLAKLKTEVVKQPVIPTKPNKLLIRCKTLEDCKKYKCNKIDICDNIFTDDDKQVKLITDCPWGKEEDIICRNVACHHHDVTQLYECEKEELICAVRNQVYYGVNKNAP